MPSCQAIAVRPVFLDLSRNTVLAPVIGVGLIFFLLALFEEMECFETVYLRAGWFLVPLQSQLWYTEILKIELPIVVNRQVKGM